MNRAAGIGAVVLAPAVSYGLGAKYGDTSGLDAVFNPIGTILAEAAGAIVGAFVGRPLAGAASAGALAVAYQSFNLMRGIGRPLGPPRPVLHPAPNATVML